MSEPKSLNEFITKGFENLKLYNQGYEAGFRDAAYDVHRIISIFLHNHPQASVIPLEEFKDFLSRNDFLL